MAIEKRLNEFIKVGTTACDIALQRVCPITEKEEADKVFRFALSGENISTEQAEIFKGYFTYFLFKLYAKYDLSTELHIGVMRNNNTKMFNKLGLDTSFDSIAEDNSIKLMSNMESGEITQDIELVGKVIRDISYNNSIKYFKM